MRERVALFDGTLTSGARAGGGFALRATLPIGRGGDAMTPIHVLIADDQALMRGGFRMILDAEPDIEVVGEAIDGADAVRGFDRLHPDVVVMDVRMPTMDGIEATRRITAADDAARVLMLTTFDLDEYVYDALRAGASGFLLKDVRPRSWCTRSASWRRRRPARPRGDQAADRGVRASAGDAGARRAPSTS